MKLWRNLLVGGIGIVLLISLLSACGTTSGGDSGGEPMLYSSAPAESNVQPWSDTPAHAFSNAKLTDLDTAQSQAQTEIERLIIKDGTLRLQVADVDDVTRQIADTAVQYGGYVLSTQVNNSSKRTASIRLTVEVAHFDTAITALQAFADEVISVSTTGTDVTEEYVDAESRLQNLEATRDRIRTFLDETEDVTEALAVNAELSRIEGEIEQVKGRMTYLSGRAAFSTITVHLHEESPPESDSDLSLGATIDRAINAQGDLLRVLVNVGIWLVIVAGPYVVISVGVVMLVRRWHRRRIAQAAADATTETL